VQQTREIAPTTEAGPDEVNRCFENECVAEGLVAEVWTGEWRLSREDAECRRLVLEMRGLEADGVKLSVRGSG
jgi:hypothetical protein